MSVGLRRYVGFVFVCDCVFKDLRTLYGCEKGGYDDGYQVC